MLLKTDSVGIGGISREHQRMPLRSFGGLRADHFHCENEIDHRPPELAGLAACLNTLPASAVSKPRLSTQFFPVCFLEKLLRVIPGFRSFLRFAATPVGIRQIAIFQTRCFEADDLLTLHQCCISEPSIVWATATRSLPARG